MPLSKSLPYFLRSSSTIAGVKRTVRATRNASGLIAVGSQAVATVALAGNALLGEVLRMAVRAAHHAHTATDALILVLNDSAIFSLADRTRRQLAKQIGFSQWLQLPE